MAATLHLAAYAPRDAARMVRAMLARRRADQRIHGLVATRVCITAELDTLTGGTPSLVRWGLLCGWESAEVRDEALADGAAFAPFVNGAREVWSVALDTVLVRQGAWRGWRPAAEGVDKLERDEPVAVITYGRIRTRYLPAFTWHNRRAVRQLAPDPAHAMRVGLADTPLARATFSLWRTQGDVARYAYRPGVHDAVQRRATADDWADEWFFARFRPVASSGTWHGRDPLAELRGPEPAAAL